MATLKNFDLNCVPDDESLNDLVSPCQITEQGEGVEEAAGIDFGNSVSEVDRNGEPNAPFSVRSSTRVFDVLDLSECSNEEGFAPQLNQANEELNIDADTSMSQGGVQQRKYRTLSNEERWAIYNALLERSENGNLKRTTTNEVSSLFSVPRITVRRIWNRAKHTPPGSFVNVSDRRARNAGRKRVTVNFNRIAQTPLPQRTTLRSLAKAAEVSHCTLYRRKKEGSLRRHSNAIKPLLREEHKLARLKFCVSMLDPSSLSQTPKFSGMYNIVHIDEKWFYMSKKTTSYYLLPDEDDPVRSCQSKNFIEKVMFIAAVARPRFDEEGNEVFSGKIGVFPFATKEPAVRRSRNREAGTLVTKPFTSVTKETIRAFLLEKIIPAIQAKWPTEDLGKTIYIQQDNARTHIRPDDEGFQIASSQSGFDIRLLYQPANSPDMNVLDLGFFNAIQSLKDKECVRTIDELIGAVQRAFERYPAKQINHVFLTLQECMKKTMTIGGSNTYKIPHDGKHSLERRGCLPREIECPSDVFENVMNVLRAHE